MNRVNSNTIRAAMLRGAECGQWQCRAPAVKLLGGLIVAAMFSVGGGEAVRADVFILRNGGRLEGELLNPTEKSRLQYEVRLPEGGTIVVPVDEVEQHTPQRAEEEEYRRIRASYSDTVEGQWELAEWCRQNKLIDQRDVHLQRVIELDPNHAPARRALGYTQIDGRWARREDELRARGLILYKGAYRTEQEIRLLEARREQELAEKDWFQKIGRWRAALGTDRGEAARNSLLTIEDPAATKALVQGLRNDRDPRARMLYAEILSRFGTPEAVKAIAAVALEDAHEEVRLTCLDYLAKKPHPDAVGYFCSQLKSKDNIMVNRAGVALGKLRDPSSIAPLIDALVTSHKYKITGNPNQYNVGFGSGGPSGFGFGNSTRIVTEAKANQAVLDALVAMTRQNFGFNQREWRNWFAMQKKSEQIDARRD